MAIRRLARFSRATVRDPGFESLRVYVEWTLSTRRVLDHFASGWFSGWASMNALKRRQLASTCRING